MREVAYAVSYDSIVVRWNEHNLRALCIELHIVFCPDPYDALSMRGDYRFFFHIFLRLTSTIVDRMM